MYTYNTYTMPKLRKIVHNERTRTDTFIVLCKFNQYNIDHVFTIYSAYTD